jgi:hypothetical protein
MGQTFGGIGCKVVDVIERAMVAPDAFQERRIPDVPDTSRYRGCKVSSESTGEVIEANNLHAQG